jgi:hypothetical protein
MKRTIRLIPVFCVLLVILLGSLISGCNPIPPAVPVAPYMKMNPPPDSNKPLPPPSNDNSCYMHTAANMLAAAGYGTGTTVQARVDDIWTDMNAHFGIANTGWMDTALQWWLGSTNNTWTTNPYTVVTLTGNKTKVPWADANGAQTIANELRSCNMVGLSLSKPTGHGGAGGHAITAWGDDSTSIAALTTNPTGLRVTDSDTDSGGAVQAYTYDAYTNPNPGGPNEGNGWYFNEGTPHPFIKHICTLSPTSGPYGPNSVRVTGSYKIHQANELQASDLHYRVGTDVDILTYRTWLDWEGTPTITESQPRRELTVDWDLSQKKVPYCTWVTISTEFVEPSWNYITYNDVQFTYPDGKYVKFPDLAWKMETPVVEKAEAIPNITGGYVIGSFDIFDPRNPSEPAVRYRLVHQYAYNQSPEFHTFILSGTSGFNVTNLRFGHSYGYPTAEELWKFENWMTRVDKTYTTSEKGTEIAIDWKGQLPYPEGDD